MLGVGAVLRNLIELAIMLAFDVEEAAEEAEEHACWEAAEEGAEDEERVDHARNAPRYSAGVMESPPNCRWWPGSMS